LKPGECAYDAVGESEVCAAESIIKPDFWLVLWLGPEDTRSRRALGLFNNVHIDFTRLAASRPDIIIQAHFKLVLLDGRTLLMRIPRRSPTSLSAGEKNAYVYSQNADELGRFSKRALSRYLQAQFSNSLRILYYLHTRRLTTPS
jgi:hypothetical protein